MSNVLSEEKKQQVIALGRLGWTLRRIEQATGVRRETAGAYLKVAGIAVRAPGGWGRRGPATPANELTAELSEAKPANEVTTDSGGQIPQKQGLQSPSPTPSASACEPYRETIELGVSRGRNAMAIWQDMVCQYGFSGGYQTVKRFVRKLQRLSTATSRRDHPDRGRRRGSGRLRHGSHGSRRAERQVQAHTAIRDDARL
jgi:hypothetical protein